MVHSIRCNCGKLQGQIERTKDVNRCVCYCTDCQGFARYLQREDEILDRLGGTSIVQTTQSNITFSEGMENLACIRLTDTGLLRWYTSCCNTPIGNTPADSKISFIGLIHNCLSSDRDSLDKEFGDRCMHVNTKYALGENKPKPRGFISGTLRVIGMILKARFNGSYKNTPLFTSELSNVAISDPKILSKQELNEVMNASR